MKQSEENMSEYLPHISMGKTFTNMIPLPETIIGWIDLNSWKQKKKSLYKKVYKLERKMTNWKNYLLYKYGNQILLSPKIQWAL